MNERTLEQALERAASLRRYRTVNSAAFERNEDHQDIVLLADEAERLRVICDKADEIVKEEWDLSLNEMIEEEDVEFIENIDRLNRI